MIANYKQPEDLPVKVFITNWERDKEGYPALFLSELERDYKIKKYVENGVKVTWENVPGDSRNRYHIRVDFKGMTGRIGK